MYGLTDKQLANMRQQMDRRHVDELRSWLVFADSMNADDIANLLQEEISRRDDLIYSIKAVGVVALAVIDNLGDATPYTAPFTYHYSTIGGGVHEVNTGLPYTVTFVDRPLLNARLGADYHYLLTTVKGHKAYLSPHIHGVAALLRRAV